MHCSNNWYVKLPERALFPGGGVNALPGLQILRRYFAGHRDDIPDLLRQIIVSAPAVIEHRQHPAGDKQPDNHKTGVAEIIVQRADPAP